jgi:hypothetical protein
VSAKTYNTILVIATLSLFIWFAYAANKQSNRREALTKENIELCESKNVEYIANSQGCFIKVEK